MNNNTNTPRFTVTRTQILDTHSMVNGRPQYCGRFATPAKAIAVAAEVNAASEAYRGRKGDYTTLRTWM